MEILIEFGILGISLLLGMIILEKVLKFFKVDFYKIIKKINDED